MHFQRSACLVNLHEFCFFERVCRSELQALDNKWGAAWHRSQEYISSLASTVRALEHRPPSCSRTGSPSRSGPSPSRDQGLRPPGINPALDNALLRPTSPNRTLETEGLRPTGWTLEAEGLRPASPNRAVETEGLGFSAKRERDDRADILCIAQRLEALERLLVDRKGLGRDRQGFQARTPDPCLPAVCWAYIVITPFQSRSRVYCDQASESETQPLHIRHDNPLTWSCTLNHKTGVLQRQKSNSAYTSKAMI